MKLQRIRPASAELRDVEQNFLALVEVMFRAYPELLSFCLEEDQQAAQVAAWEEQAREHFDLHVGLATEVTEDFEQEMCEAVSAFITEVVNERPETLDILRGRTFARTLH
jgi:hypothetical protein